MASVGEPIREIEVTPISIPVESPVTAPATPERERVPA